MPEAEAHVGLATKDLRQFYVSQQGGGYNCSYGLVALRKRVAEEGDPRTAAAVVGETEEGVIVLALPNDAWHRTLPGRKFPPPLSGWCAPTLWEWSHLK